MASTSSFTAGERDLYERLLKFQNVSQFLPQVAATFMDSVMELIVEVVKLSETDSATFVDLLRREISDVVVTYYLGEILQFNVTFAFARGHGTNTYRKLKDNVFAPSIWSELYENLLPRHVSHNGAEMRTRDYLSLQLQRFSDVDADTKVAYLEVFDAH